MRKGFNVGFTLMELIIVIAVLGIIAVSATTLFYRSIRTTNKSDSITESDKNAQFALTIIERFVRNARKVVAIGGGDCPGTSDNLTLLADDNAQVQFSLVDGRIASNSSFLTTPSVTIQNLVFTCTRTEGLNDQITVSFDVIHTTTANDVTTQKTYTKIINLRNFL
jgi:prepilin-type N-terminal cleavage/methylation domain-containing protein